MNIRERVPVPMNERRSGSMDEACIRYGLGKKLMRDVVRDAGAEIHVGTRLLVNYAKVDRYLDAISE